MVEYKKVCQFFTVLEDIMPVKVAVIGAGPAGYPAALTAARLGAEVTVIEKARAGGVCLHSGCIPSKTLLDAAHRFDAVKQITDLCKENAEPHAQAIMKEISWPKIQQRQQTITNKLTAGILGMFRQAKINFYDGVASFKDAHTLCAELEGNTLTLPFDFAIVATGTTAFVPPPFDKIRQHVYDNSNIFLMERLPRILTIVGGGAIGCEFATLMMSLGVTVNLVEMQERLLPNMDENLSRLLGQNLQKRRVNLFLGKKAVDARVEGDKKILTLNDGSVLETDAVLVAIGRQCDLTELKPENAGLKWNRKGLEGVNPQTMQVTDNIYAAGDVTGFSLLAHAGSRQGMVAASNICGRAMKYNNDLIPNAVYTFPELASVGLTRHQAHERGIEVKSHKAYMAANARAMTMGITDGFIEILSDKNSGKLLGVMLAAPNASEIISAFTVALEAGFTVSRLQEVVFPHPTVSEAIADALAR